MTSESMPRWFTAVKNRVLHPWILLTSCISLVLYIVEAVGQHMFTSLPAIALAIATIGAFVCMVVRPRVGCFLALLCLVVSLVVPFSVPSVSIAMLYVVMGVLGSQGGYAILPAMVIALMATVYNSYTNGDGHFMNPMDVIIGLVTFSAAYLVGAVYRESRLRKRADQQHAIDAERFRVARSLHDEVANDITRILLQVDDDGEPIDRLSIRRQLHETLHDTHHIINALESGRDSVPVSGNWGELIAVCNDAKMQLSRNGFDGEMVVAHHDCVVSPDVIDLYKGVMRETVTNIMKYADNNFPYAITLQIDKNTLMLQVADICRQVDNHGYGMASGFKRYQQLFESLGGAVEYQRQGNRWSSSFLMPM